MARRNPYPVRYNPFLAVCATNAGSITIDLTPYGNWDPTAASKVIKAVESYRLNASPGYIRRATSTLNDFAAFCASRSHTPTLDRIIYSGYLKEFRDAIYLNRGHKLARSVADSWRSFSQLMLHLQHKNAVPVDLLIPPPLRHPSHATETNERCRSSHLGPSYSDFTIIRNKSCPSEIEDQVKHRYPRFMQLHPYASDEEWLTAYESDQRDTFNILRDCALDDIRTALADYKRGLELIGDADIEAIRRAYNAGEDLIDTTNRPHLSFFSPAHPNGLSNILAWAYHEADGIMCKGRHPSHRSFPGVHHAHSHIGGIDQLRRHLGLTMDTAVAMAVVITGEAGINIDSLRAARIANSKGQTTITTLLDNSEYVRLRIPKPRKGSEISKAILRGHDNLINAEYCLRLAVLMTDRMRASKNLSHLWLHATQKGVASVPTPQAWRSAWKRFLSRHADRLGAIINRNPQLHQIRGTAGILAFFDGLGSVEAVARKLNNTPSTVLRCYLPSDLIDIYFRRTIRRVQNTLVLLAVNDAPYAPQALGLQSQNDIAIAMQRILADPAHTEWLRQLFLRTKTYETNQTSQPAEQRQFAIVYSSSNVALLLLFRDHIDALKLSHPVPDLLSKHYAAMPIRVWYELASYLARYGESTADRGHRLIYQNAVQMKSKIRSEVVFPSIEDLFSA